MNSSSDKLVESFTTVKADHLIFAGPYDELHRVRDLEENVWLLGRFYVNPIDPTKLKDVENEFEKCRSIQNEFVTPTHKILIEDNQLAVFWQYRDGSTIEERLIREFGPRNIIQFLLKVVRAIQDTRELQVRFEYLSFHDILVDMTDNPILMPGSFSHLLSGKGDTTGVVEDYEQRVLYRLGAVLLSICFGRQYDELIEAAKLETEVDVLMDRFRDLMGIDPSLMAIIAKSLMPIESKRYQSLDELALDLEGYLKGRAVTVEGIDFYKLIQSWRERKKERES